MLHIYKPYFAVSLPGWESFTTISSIAPRPTAAQPPPLLLPAAMACLLSLPSNLDLATNLDMITLIAGISRCTHKALYRVLIGFFACCHHSCSCLQVWECPELPAGNNQLLVSTFWVFLTDSFSPCSPGRHSEGIRSLCVAPGTLSLSGLSRRGESCSRAQVQAAEGRTAHNERKRGTVPLQKQINNTFGGKKKKRRSRNSSQQNGQNPFLPPAIVGCTGWSVFTLKAWQRLGDFSTVYK